MPIVDAYSLIALPRGWGPHLTIGCNTDRKALNHIESILNIVSMLEPIVLYAVSEIG